jgi:endonuclease/exonuclease/phosphatase (EEP) superfamily protein YafD
LTVSSFNVNFGLAGDDATLEAIATLDTDVVLLQETTPDWERLIRLRLGETYPFMEFHHSPGAGGLATLCRCTVRHAALLPARHGWFPAWRALISSPLGEVQVLNVHLHPPISDSGSVLSGVLTTPPIREREVVDFTAQLFADVPTVIAGDFNESDGDAIGTLESRGFRSALPQDATTWRWDTSVGTITGRLDHLVYDERFLTPVDVEVIPAGRSDHFPVRGAFAAVPRRMAGADEEKSRTRDVDSTSFAPANQRF